MFFCVLSSLVASGLFAIPFQTAIGPGLFTSLAGLRGDLLASFYKRVCGIKDYSNVLPGQGGFLDRFDSFMAAAFCYTLLGYVTVILEVAFLR